MKKIYEQLRLPVQKADVGIEIEVEGEKLPPIVVNTFWRSEDDGSLRGKYPGGRGEYVIHTPILIGQVKEAMAELNQEFEKAKAVLSFSFRTSVHVHVNAHNMNELQLLNMVYTYLLIEEPLMTYCGKDRKCNRFCLRLQDAEGLMDNVMKLVNEGVSGLVKLPEDNIRYSALNLASIKKYGTVEFRAMRGNSDVAIINTWASALVRLRDWAMLQESPQAIYEMFVKMNGEGFLQEVLGEYAKPFVYPKMAKDMQRSFSLSIDIPFAYIRAIEEKKKKEERKKLMKEEEEKVEVEIDFRIPPARMRNVRLEPVQAFRQIDQEIWAAGEARLAQRHLGRIVIQVPEAIKVAGMHVPVVPGDVVEYLNDNTVTINGRQYIL